MEMLEDVEELGHLRIPSCQDVLEAVRENRVISLLFEDSPFKSTGSATAFFDVTLWKPFRAAVMHELMNCFASADKDIEKMEKKYFNARMGLLRSEVVALRMINHFVVPQEHKAFASCLLQAMRIRFIESFHKLITPISSAAACTVTQQVREWAIKSLELPTEQLFPCKTTQEHIYYIVGFFGHQAAKEAKRRKKDSLVAKFLTHFASAHFHRQSDEAYREIEANGVTPIGMVKKRVALGGLKFASVKCWSVFAKIEYIYANLVTPANFIFVGGTLSGDICKSIVQNSDMQHLFFSLLDSDYNPSNVSEASKDAFITCFGYVMRVFGRVRGKDVARRYNSGTFKGNQITFRARIGALAGKKRKGATKAKANTTSSTQSTPAASSTTIVVESEPSFRAQTAEPSTAGAISTVPSTSTTETALEPSSRSARAARRSALCDGLVIEIVELPSAAGDSEAEAVADSDTDAAELHATFISELDNVDCDDELDEDVGRKITTMDDDEEVN